MSTPASAPPADPFQSESALTLALTRLATETASGTVFVDASGDRLERLAAAARIVAPSLPVLTLPAWDCLPYDRSPPSPRVVGLRVATLRALAEGIAGPHLLLTSARALAQRVQPASAWREATLTLRTGQAMTVTELADALGRFGYRADERVDEPGEVAVRGPVLDVFPGDSETPVRLEIEAGTIRSIAAFDAETQRSGDALDLLTLHPVAEFPVSDAAAAAAAGAILQPADDDEAEPDAPEQPDDDQRLVSPLRYMASAAIVLHPQATARWAEWDEQVADAFAAHVRLASEVPRLPPKRLYSTGPALLREVGARAVELDFAGAAPLSPASRFVDVAAQAKAASGRVVIAAGSETAARQLASGLSRRAKLEAPFVPDWASAAEHAASCLPLDLSDGCDLEGLRVIAAPTAPPRQKAVAFVEEPPRASDVVVHEEHGVCRLAGLRTVEDEERVALEFAEGTELLVPTDELDRLWRYGSAAGGIGLDRLNGEAWRKRRDAIGAEIEEAAKALAAQAAHRATLCAPAMRPAAAAMARFTNRFAYTPSPDQQDAIDATLADLAAGKPMDRLVCGDVGFGKTEVALRAAAAAALCGWQVAIMAPTTVLARQHYETFRRRFRGFDVRVEPMLRGATSGDVRTGLASGQVAIVVGTHAIAAETVRFARLGLVVIDEEQRFGDAQKARLAKLRNPEGGVHTLVMSATPIPRTLQTAMVGLRDVSVIATPPVRRRPTRTYVVPFDPVVAREALMREHRRDGQSFVVCPRIESIGPMEARLRELVPELDLAVAHGRMKPEALETIVAAFAEGEHDVLLATNIIEAGLDIPRANTILIDRPDRFGLSQLHQMRGRVGRGERGGVAYLLTDPGAPLASATLRRLRTLERQEGLGAGFAISMADMDARGAGDLLGQTQAGHVRAVGTELYQHLMRREMARARGEPEPRPAPELRVEVGGRIPDELVPESNLRLELYRRLARLPDAAAVADFAEELEDRFGAMPEPLVRLLDLVRLRVWCTAAGVLRVDAGPQAVALTLGDEPAATALAGRLGDGWRSREARAILDLSVANPASRLGALLERVESLG